MLALLAFLHATGAGAAGAASWGADAFRVQVGEGVAGQAGLRLSPDASGKVFVTVPVDALSLDSYSLVEIDMDVPDGTDRLLIWKSAAWGERRFEYLLPEANTGSVDMRYVQPWQGAATELGIALELAPGESATLRRLRVTQPSLGYLAQKQLRDWLAIRPWRDWDVNFYTGTLSPKHKPFPAPVFAALLGVSLLIYAVSVVLRRGARFDWRVAGGLILLCWVALDLLWQQRLIDQLRMTWDRFAGKTVAEKLLASPDAEAVAFAERVKPLITGHAPRVFIVTESDTNGMLAAYYLAPHNVYWNRRAATIPEREFLQSGDYLVLAMPAGAHFVPQRSAFRLPGGEWLPVGVLYSDSFGALVKVR